MKRIMDAGGLLQFYTGWREPSPVMLLEYTLYGAVDREKLQTALEKAIDVFSAYRVRLALNEKRQPVYEENELVPIVYEDDCRAHAFGKESRGYLFRLSFHGRTIRLSIHHALTDCFGANEFLKYILRNYLRQFDEGICVSTDTVAVDPSDLRDPYDLYGDIHAGGYNISDSWKNELVIPNSLRYRRELPQQSRRILFRLEKLLLIAKKNESSVFPVVSWLVANAAARTYDAEDKVIVGGGAADYRKIYSSRTPFCFSHSFKTLLLPRERYMDLETRLTVQRARMDLMLDRETTDREIALRRRAADRKNGPIEEYVMDQDALDAERKEGEKKSAFFLSYLGKLDLPDDIAEYVGSCEVITPTTRGPVKAVAYSWKGIMCINLIEQACERSMIPELQRMLAEYAIDSSVTDPRERFYDHFPMEELISDGRNRTPPPCPGDA